MIHDKTGLLHLAEIMAERGIKNLVVSPGSRNAPIVTVFCSRPDMECITIVDERSAAFFALGMAQQLGKPVAIACTSGSAALNYAPAIVEAYYQKIPLVVLTADRPVEWIDQGDGQTIRQNRVFENYIKKSVQLPQSTGNLDDLHYNDRLISEALNACTFPSAGPVHINMPFTEPLYGFDHELKTGTRHFQIAKTIARLEDEQLKSMAAIWNGSARKMILTGQMPPDGEIEKILAAYAEMPDTVVLTETTSNVVHPLFISNIDRFLHSIPTDKTGIVPDLLVSIGGTIVSKQIKSFLRQLPVKTHWHIDPSDLQMDTFQHLSLSAPMDAIEFLQQLKPEIKPVESTYAKSLCAFAVESKKKHHDFLENCPYADLKIFGILLRYIPEGYDIQLANSTPVRYAQLFDFDKKYRFDSNRGTSGIDGSMSTAAGAAYASGRPTLFITGDLGFFYDSNALWNKHLPQNLKIIMINNEGGGIFRFIPGPDSTGMLEDYFEARHQTSAAHIAKAFGLDYVFVENEGELQKVLPAFFEPAEKPVILEIKSPAKTSAKVLRDYFKALKP